MNFINKILIFLLFLGVGFWIAGLFPSSVMEGQQNETKSNPGGVQLEDKSRITFHNEVFPKYYPLLVKFLKENKSETLSWRDDSGEDKKVYLSFSHYQGVALETEFYLGGSSNDTPLSAQPLHVRMIDNNTDGVMDSIEMIKSDGDSRSFEPPFDELQKYMWDVSLAIAFRLSKCCS